MSARSPSDQQTSQPKSKPRRISELSYVTLRKLSNRLDTLNDGKESYWRKLVEVMPGLGYDQSTVERFALNANKQDGSPAYALLTDMSNRGVGYDELITALKKLHLNTALHDLGHREGVRFKVQPEASPVVEGQRLELECEATGVPGPSYLWFKSPQIPLPEQTQRLLIIERVSKDDVGMYCCRATNDVNVVFSNWAEVKVMKPAILNKTAVPGFQPEAPNILQNLPEKVVCYIDQELHLVLVAEGCGQLQYQWFRDGKKLPYGTSNELLVNGVGLGDQGVYNCRVTSDLGGSVMSGDSTVTVLDPRQVHPPPTVTHTGTLTTITSSSGYIPTPVSVGPPPNVIQPVFLPPEEIVTQFIDTSPGQMHPDLQPLHPHLPPAQGYPPISVAPGDHYPPRGGLYSNGQSYEVSEHQQYQTGGGGGEQGNGQYNMILNGMEHIYEGRHHVEDIPCGQGLETPDLDEPCYDKVALLIGNKNYRQGVLQLNTPENDTLDLAGVLRSAGFKVVSLVNLTKEEMDQAVRYFASLLGKNVYALFFFAGHGFETNGTNYMMPVDADVEKKTEQCVCAQNVLYTMQLCGSKLSIVLLDMCRVSTPTPSGGSIRVFPTQGTRGYFVIGFSCSPAEKAFEAGGADDSSIKEEDKENSIFVAALKEHLQQGSLTERVDTLLTDAAAGVRKRGKYIGTALGTWMKPEIRHNLGEKLSLADEIKNDREVDFERQTRAEIWQEAHLVPETTVVCCHGNPQAGVKAGEVVLRVHFEAEHSNVLLVTTELLNGCLTSTEIVAMEMSLISEGQVPLKAEPDKEYKFSERSRFNQHQFGRANDLMHFKIPDIQKIKSQTVLLVIRMEYFFEIQREGPTIRRSCEIHHSLYPPLYAKTLYKFQDNMAPPLPGHVTGFHHHGNMAQHL